MKIIGVYNADGGVVGELTYFFGHLVGAKECSLCDITHSPFAKKSQWKKMEQQLHEEMELEFELVHKNERSPEVTALSEGKEPCVILEDNSGNLSIIFDQHELKKTQGDVDVFEQSLRKKLAAL